MGGGRGGQPKLTISCVRKSKSTYMATTHTRLLLFARISLLCCGPSKNTLGWHSYLGGKSNQCIITDEVVGMVPAYTKSSLIVVDLGFVCIFSACLAKPQLHNHPFWQKECKNVKVNSTGSVCRCTLQLERASFNFQLPAMVTNDIPQALHQNCIHVMESLGKVCQNLLFNSFFNDFDCFWPCEHMRKHAFAGQNTQQNQFY